MSRARIESLIRFRRTIPRRGATRLVACLTLSRRLVAPVTIVAVRNAVYWRVMDAVKRMRQCLWECTPARPKIEVEE